MKVLLASLEELHCCIFLVCLFVLPVVLNELVVWISSFACRFLPFGTESLDERNATVAVCIVGAWSFGPGRIWFIGCLLGILAAFLRTFDKWFCIKQSKVHFVHSFAVGVIRRKMRMLASGHGLFCHGTPDNILNWKRRKRIRKRLRRFFSDEATFQCLLNNWNEQLLEVSNRLYPKSFISFAW